MSPTSLKCDLTQFLCYRNSKMLIEKDCKYDNGASARICELEQPLQKYLISVHICTYGRIYGLNNVYLNWRVLTRTGTRGHVPPIILGSTSARMRYEKASLTWLPIYIFSSSSNKRLFLWFMVGVIRLELPPPHALDFFRRHRYILARRAYNAMSLAFCFLQVSFRMDVTRLY